MMQNTHTHRHKPADVFTFLSLKVAWLPFLDLRSSFPTRRKSSIQHCFPYILLYENTQFGFHIDDLLNNALFRHVS